MRRILFIVSPIILGILLFSGVAYFISSASSGKGALQVTSLPPSDVYLNGKYIGKTPLCKCEGSDTLPIGDYVVRLVPTSGGGLSPFEQKIRIVKSVLTVVDETFGIGSAGSGSVITLDPLNNSNAAQIFISSFPLSVSVSLDNNPVGNTPLLLNSVTASDHTLTLSKNGYIDKTIHVHAVSGYQLNAQVTLGIDLGNITPSTQSAVATPSASLTPALNAAGANQVTILETGTGFLRVRAQPSLNASEEARLTPGDTVTLVDEQGDWYEVKLKDGTLGWISSTYAKKD